MPPTTSAAEGSKDGDYLNLRDSFVPLFSGQPQDYKEYRKRLMLYHHKMKISKRSADSVLNILGSFQGVTWRLFEDFSVEEAEKEDGFSKIITKLDKNFEYDDRVLLPNDFEEYFNLLQRKPQQSLLSFVTDHDTAYRRLTAHNVTLPVQVQGWHLLRRAALSKEQRQMVTLKAPTLEKNPVIEALYLLFGQDYKAGGWNAERERKFNRWKGRGYAAFDEEDAYWSEQPWTEDAYYEADDWYDDTAPDDEADFDYDAIYYGEEDEPGEHHDLSEDPQELAEEYDHAYMPPTWMPGKDSSSSSWLVATCRSSPSLMARTLRPPLDPLHLRRAPARTKERARAKAKEKERMWCAIHPPQVERLIQKVAQRQLHAFVVANQVIGQRNVHKVRNHPHRPTRDLHPLRVWPCRMRPPWSCSRMRWAPTDRMPPCLTQVHLPSCADMVHSAAI